MDYLKSIEITRTKSSVRLRSPAKINLYLRVLDERPDGYHNLENLMQTISLCDEIEIELDGSGEVTLQCSSPDVPGGEDNIAFRAAVRFFQGAALHAGAHIKLTKRIPVGAGLGGGSSNAGTVLLGLNELLGAPLSMEKLVETAIGLGSDVPFFLHGGFALCRGRGEKVESLKAIDEYWVVLINPGIFISTRRVYDIYKKKCLTLKEKAGIQLNWSILKSTRDLAAIMKNDLEEAVKKECPLVTDIQQGLKDSGCKDVMVTGSGSTVFGLCQTRAQASRTILNLQKRLNDEKFLILEASNRL